MTITEALSGATRQLEAVGVDDPRRQATSLLTFTLSQPHSFIIAHPEYELGASEQRSFTVFVARRSAREPLQYITRHQEFWGLDFELVPGILVPRPETEILVETAVKHLNKIEKPTFCELGVGSGCVSISMLHTVGTARAVAIDVSATALGIARRNAEKHGVSDRLELQAASSHDVFDRMFDCIVSNPPYIPSSDIPGLQPEVRDFEDHKALDGGPDGLEVIRQLIGQAPKHLRSGGPILIEIGQGQADTVSRLFAADFWRRPRFINDLQGIRRVVSAIRT